LDLAEPDVTSLNLAQSGHSWAVIAAGTRDMTLCEQEKESTWRINVVGTLEVARQLSEQGIGVIFLSSDAVFDGSTGCYTDDFPPDPVNEYGRQKEEVERGLPGATSGRYLVLRLSKIVGVCKGDGTLLDEMAQQLTSGQRLRAAKDQVFTPICVDDLPAVITALQEVKARGIFNVAGPEAWDRFAVAQCLANRLGLDGRSVQEISLKDLGDELPRPERLGLQCDRLARTVSVKLTPLSKCLKMVAQNYQGGGFSQ